MTWTEPRLYTVPVDGGDLTVSRWGSGSKVVLASHGLTANHRSFAEVAAQLEERHADVALHAVDHRGRGGSATLPGPYGLAAHARDLVAVIDHLDVPSAVLLGHSMGAFVAAAAAEFAGDRVQGLVLIDGGLPIAVDLPDDADVEDVVRSVIGPALDRLDATFPSPEHYLQMWREHPAFGGRYFTDVAEAYVRYDLVQDGEVWRSPVNKAAVLADGRSTLQDGRSRSAISRIQTPTTLLWTPRGLGDEEPGLYPGAVIESVVRELHHVDARLVDDTNHYSIVLGPAGAQAVAEAIESRLPQP